MQGYSTGATDTAVAGITECLRAIGELMFDAGKLSERIEDVALAVGKLGDALSIDEATVFDHVCREGDRLASMPYTEYLLSSEWRARRLEALKADGNRCRLCNSPGPLHVHHRTYERRGFELPEDLTVLCEPCHSAHHGR